jgi:signal transduction histidine kinase
VSRRIREHPNSRPANLDDVRGLEILDGLDDDVIAWIVERAHVNEFSAEEVIIEYGDEAEEMTILLSGAAEFEFSTRGQAIARFDLEPGEVGGVLPYSRMKVYKGKLVSKQAGRFLWIGREHLPELVHIDPELGQRLVSLMADRVRDATRWTEQRERMAALGTLSAGLAHELNNPASAVRRSSSALRERLATLPDLVARIADSGLSYDQVCVTDRLRAVAKERTRTRLSMIERGAREDAMADWLDERGVPEANVRAETLVDAGLTPEDVRQATEELPDHALPAALAWVEGGLATDRLLNEIDIAAGRIAELVAAVKEYSHMDRAPDRQPVDLGAGIDTTLTILDHKLRKKDIRVERQWSDGLPEVSGYPGELNQVWTNLIDNAIDAMEDGGTLRIEIERAGSHVDVRIVDDGHGIPDDIQARIFDPFFTTKDVGLGTGLGLDIVRRIIEGKHGGSISVDSKPGRTVFTVHLASA